MRKRITVIQETDSGRNTKFRDNKTGETMSLKKFVKKIENNQYPNYHIRNINGVDTPCSNPDKSENNNLN